MDGFPRRQRIAATGRGGNDGCVLAVGKRRGPYYAPETGSGSGVQPEHEMSDGTTTAGEWTRAA